MHGFAHEAVIETCNARGKSGTFNFLQMAAIDVTPTQRRSSRLCRRVATLLVLSTTALCALALADSAWASGSNPSSDPLPGSADTAVPADPTAATATPAEQPAPPAVDQSALEAATQQAATAVANASQDNVQNIVVIIRINSPGDDVINQSNTAIANAVAANTSSTNQGSGGGSADTDRGQPDGTTPDTSAASSTPPTAMPAQVAPAPAASSAATPPVTAAPPAHRLATQGSERARPRAFAAAQRPSSGPPSSGHGHHAASAAVAAAHAPAAPAAQQAAAEPIQQVAPREVASAVPRSTSAPRVGERRSFLILAPARAHRAAARAGAGAAHILGSFGRLPALSGDAADKADPVSTVVVLTLLAVLVAIFLGVGSTYVPAVRAWAGR
jgi:hypothetical protein